MFSFWKTCYFENFILLLLLFFYSQGLRRWFSTLVVFWNLLGSSAKYWWLDLTSRNCDSVGLGCSQIRVPKMIELLGSSGFFLKIFNCFTVSALHSLLQWHTHSHGSLKVLPYFFCFQVCPSVCLLFEPFFIFQFIWVVW